jgi:hypothetical protein
MKNIRFIFLIVSSLFIFSCAANQVAPMSRSVNNDWVATDNLGKSIPLRQLAGPNGLILIAHKCECPIVRKYSAKVEKLREQLKTEGVNLVYLNMYDEQAPDKLSAYRKEFKVETPIYFDRDSKLTKALQIERTSEAVYIDKNWQIVYQGAIDDRFDYETDRPVKYDYLLDAVKNSLAGQRPESVRTSAKGCMID